MAGTPMSNPFPNITKKFTDPWRFHSREFENKTYSNDQIKTRILI
jgi:hypothetical protein